MRETSVDTRERRSAGRRHAEIDDGLEAALVAALVDAGWTVRSRAIPAVGLPAAGLCVLRAGPGLRDCGDVVGEARSATVAIVVPPDGEGFVQLAATLTPFVYPAALPACALATLLTSAAETSGRAHRRPAAPDTLPPRSVCIRLGEGVELDGVPIALGIAERNFLFELAARRGAWLSKEDDVATGGGREVGARECRRRLGKRLGAELASQLVPEIRGEPYRLREPDELERLAGTRGARVQLRIIGRAGARLTFLPGIERFPSEPARDPIRRR